MSFDSIAIMPVDFSYAGGNFKEFLSLDMMGTNREKVFSFLKRILKIDLMLSYLFLFRSCIGFLSYFYGLVTGFTRKIFTISARNTNFHEKSLENSFPRKILIRCLAN